jgi:hypothetical protein
VVLFTGINLPKQCPDLLISLHQYEHDLVSSGMANGKDSMAGSASPQAPAAASAAAFSLAGQTSAAVDMLSVASWCLSHHLVSLNLGPLVFASPNDVLMMVATLKRLRLLKLQVMQQPQPSVD